MKIVIINNLYYPFNRGGAENVVRRLINDLQAQAHTVYLITAKPLGASSPDNLDCQTYFFPSRYFDLANFSLPKKLLWHITNLFSLQQTRAILKKINTIQPDLVITHNLMGLGFLLPLYLRRLKIRHEHYLHDIQLLHPSGLIIFGQENIINSSWAKLYQFFTRHYFGSPSKVISPSHWLLEQYKNKNFFPNSTFEIKPFVQKNLNPVNQNLNKETTLVNTMLPSQPKTKFLFVGQIEQHKGIILLINAFKKVLDNRPGAELTIIGDGQLLLEAKKLAAQTPAIKFLGRLESAAVYRLMAASDYLIVPSLCYENSPTTIYEAHALNLPVIAAQIGGIPEITKTTDYLFAPNNIDDLINKLLACSA